MIKAPSSFRSSARWIPAVFVGGMLAVVAVNATLVFFAFQSWSGIATPRAFERGLGYNRLLAAAAREDELGWQAEVDLRRGAGDADGSIVVQLHDRHGRPIEAVLVAELSRPLEAAPPIAVALLPAGPGRSQAVLESPLRSGQWDIRVTADRDADRLHLHRRVVVR